MHLLRRYGIVVAAALAIGATVLAYAGRMPTIVRGPHVDKLFHFLLFGLVTFFWVLRWGDGRITRLRLPKAIVVPLAFAALEEAAQHLSARRTPDLVDLGCDLLGMVTFWWIATRRMAPEASHR